MYQVTIDGIMVGNHIEKADHFFSRLKGLMFRSELELGYGCWIIPCMQIHTCFMQTPIDVVYLSGDGVILDVEKNLLPWKVGKKIKGTQSILELAPNSIECYKIQPNQIVIFIPI